MAVPWWEFEVPGYAREALEGVVGQIEAADELNDSETAVALLGNIIPPSGTQLPAWAIGAIRGRLRHILGYVNSPSIWAEVYRASRNVVTNRDTGITTHLADPLQLTRDSYTDERGDQRLAHFAELGLAPGLQTIQGLQETPARWPNAYAGLITRPWTRAMHHRLSPQEQQVILTVLMCARRLDLHLPNELWLHIFEFLDRADLQGGF